MQLEIRLPHTIILRSVVAADDSFDITFHSIIVG